MAGEFPSRPSRFTPRLIGLGRVLGIAGVIGLLLNSAALLYAAPEALRPNIIFMLADDLGSHDVGWRGGEIKTPHLDRLAFAGARLDQFYVQPVCSPTRAALTQLPQVESENRNFNNFSVGFLT